MEKYMNIQQRRLFQKVEISVASPKQIRRWAERFLPTGEKVGEVTSWETVNYKTLKPEPNGLFCQKIFGTVVDFTCSCGKKSSKLQRGFCPKCGVERTQSRVRRYRLGYIKLKQPIVHSLYASHRPSPLTLCLGWATKRMQLVLKTADFCSLPQRFTIFRSRFEFRKIYQKSRLFSKYSSSHFEKMGESIHPDFAGKPFSKNSIFGPEGVLKWSLKQPFSKKSNFGQNTETRTFDEVQENEKKKRARNPRLFGGYQKQNPSKPKILKPPLFFFNNAEPEPRLYGIAYDETWSEVEEFQEFLFYIWEQAFAYEWSVGYYAFTKDIENHTKTLPKHEQSFGIQTGGFAFQHVLAHLDCFNIQVELDAHSHQLSIYRCFLQEELVALDLSNWEDRKEAKKIRIKLNRLQQLQIKCRRQQELFRDFDYAGTQPAWMVLNYLPVLPPGLRPITSIRGELIVSDINSLYRKVLIRNNRITRGAHFGVFETALSGSWLSWCYNLRQVQEAVDELLKTGSIESGKPLKSLLEGLKGKQGRFRQHILGKRVDYSGRSVIVVGPKLQLHQCGLPKQMAIELFQPFLIQKLRKKGIVVTTTAAKALIAERKPIVWILLREILKTHPVLLNRAPTLHRLGIQAFLPQLVEGKAILLHPLVCPAFNADFDGDQMAVHVPLSPKTRAEALELLWSRNNILAPSSGQPLLLPTQDMVLGFYYLTCSKDQPSQFTESVLSSHQAVNKNQEMLENTNTLWFSDLAQVQKAYDRGFLSLQSTIWVRWPGFVQTFTSELQARLRETVLEIRLNDLGSKESVFSETCSFVNPVLKPIQAIQNLESNFGKPFIRTTTGRVLLYFWIQTSAPSLSRAHF